MAFSILPPENTNFTTVTPKKSTQKINPLLATPTDIAPEGVKDISKTLNTLLADVYAIYLKTKNFHWHISGEHFRDYHLLLDEQADQLFAMTDTIAERVRKLGGISLHSIGEISDLQRISDNNSDYVNPSAMLSELLADTETFIINLREARTVCDKYHDNATVAIIEVWLDESERRKWFLFEMTR